MEVKVKEIRKHNGYDCWGRPEFDDCYAVINENGEVIYTTKDDPTDLINYLCGK